MSFRTSDIRRGIRYTSYSMLGWLMLFTFLCLLFPVRDEVEFSVLITDNKNELLHGYLTSDEKWRMKAEAGEVSPLLRKTLVHKEDRYFYYHPGVNVPAAVRALMSNLISLKRKSGASTITMQVARALEPKRRTYVNKCIEVFRALQLELKYSKDEILLMYLNLIPYGGNIEGVKAASMLYFKKAPDHLSLAEITALSIIPNRPSSLVIGRNNDLIVQERNRWLRKFQQENVFTQKQIYDALEEPLNAGRSEVPRNIPQLAWKLRHAGKNTIRTTIDWNTQQKAEKLVKDYVRGLYHRNIRNASVMIIDNRTGAVITYVGSADVNDTLDAGQVNGAAAVRQPGSTLKPLVYGLAIDDGLLTPRKMMMDVPVTYAGYAPENYDQRFNGYITMEYALEHSLNIPAVKTMQQVGKNRLIQVLSDCNFKQIRKDQRKLGLSMILGGCGATLQELTGLYSAFANGGWYSRPVYLQDEQAEKKKHILSEAAVFMINETLSKVNRPDFPVNWQATERMPRIAWKTGTSYGRRDAWSIGYNRNFTVGVWVGNFSGLGVPELSGANTATPLLFKIFNSIDYDSDQEWFQQPETCEMRKVCSETGMPPSEDCRDVVMDYFIPLVSDIKTCNNMQEFMISPDERMSYCRTCMPENGFKRKRYRVIPAEMQEYLTTVNMSFEGIPAHNPACEKVFREGAPLIISPGNRAEYLISKSSPEPIALSCNAGNDVSKVYWYVNNRFYRSADVNTKQFFIPEEGSTKISCTDDKGRNRDVWISVRYVDF